MKVLLFVQTGDERPKCVTPGRGLTVRVNGEWWLSWLARDAKLAADRWWLVECENADAGRWAITNHHSTRADYVCDSAACRCAGARILASGGRP